MKKKVFPSIITLPEDFGLPIEKINCKPWMESLGGGQGGEPKARETLVCYLSQPHEAARICKTTPHQLPGRFNKTP